ncbi:hypothetical protein DIURU_000372 [Diutina rugosa]|uniref:Zn(2)-C6 fungal-type domain-containing protein n=1 Tax=Diutina rugosa TaxID=5481 RepID=A0A642V547_DIURU|nr:uncharacterized protein DIURU_000372 [Diutina rugosa]KAA8907962.1 hypothetical protein DIURU_000372 [Diutina rugosa]
MMSPPRAQRKRHRNSRLGCDTCKRRKVKCSEDLPQCKNCVKYKVKCDYLDKRPEELEAIRYKAMMEARYEASAPQRAPATLHQPAIALAPGAGAPLPAVVPPPPSAAIAAPPSAPSAPSAAAVGASAAATAPSVYLPSFSMPQDPFVPQPQQLYPQIYYMNPMTSFASMPLTSSFPAPGAPPPEPPPPAKLPTTTPAPAPEVVPASAPEVPALPPPPPGVPKPSGPPKLHRNKLPSSTFLRTTLDALEYRRRRDDNQGFFDAMLLSAYDGDRRAWTAALELGRYVVSLKLRS